MKLNRKTSPKTFTDYRPLSRERLAQGAETDGWHLAILAISFGMIILAVIVTAAVGS